MQGMKKVGTTGTGNFAIRMLLKIRLLRSEWCPLKRKTLLWLEVITRLGEGGEHCTGLCTKNEKEKWNWGEWIVRRSNRGEQDYCTGESYRQERSKQLWSRRNLKQAYWKEWGRIWISKEQVIKEENLLE